MTQTYIPPGGWKTEYQKPLFYHVWLVGDQKGSACALVLVFLLLVFGAAQATGSLFGGLVAFCALFPTIWRLFVPTYFEINSDGIVQKVFGRRRFIAWDDIRSYQVRHRGVLLLPRTDRYFLEAFRGTYLPVPHSLTTEVLYRFRVYVDRVDD